MASSASRIPVVYNKAYKVSGTKSYVYALNKFGFAPTIAGTYSRTNNKLVKKLADGTTHAVGAADQQNDSFYTCPVSIGTPAQVVNLDFDSGSSDLWVKTPQTASGEGASTGTFDSSKSSTFEKTSSTWQIQYGDGSSASGTVGNDTVKIGDISIEGQAVEVATKLSQQFQTEASSGLLGLAFGTINTVKPTPVATPVENMKAQKDITNALFTCYLGSTAAGTASDGFYTFGEIDNATVQASGQDLTYVDVDNSQGFWMFDAPTATVGGQQVSLPSNNKAIADTGTTLMLVSDAFCKAIYDQIEGSKQDSQAYIFPKGAKIPKVTVNVGQAEITIAAEELAFQDLGNGYYYGGIQSVGDLGFDIWGDIFLKNVYAVFDADAPRFGVVQRASSSSDGNGTTSGTGTGNGTTSGNGTGNGSYGQ